MALAIPFQGSGEFVPVRVWSCREHDNDNLRYHDDEWETDHGETCLECEAGVWRDKKDAAGNAVLRELSVWEWGFRQMAEKDGLLSAMGEMVFKPNAKIEWLEDELLPRTSAV